MECVGHERPLVAVSVVVRRGGCVLLVKEHAGPNRGRWNLPGGRVKRGETLRKAAAREVLEEAGLRVRVSRPVAIRYRRWRPGLTALVHVVFEGVGRSRGGGAEMESAWFTRAATRRLRMTNVARAFAWARGLVVVDGR
jgi:ADP-ribose pyrophosphatase YjhB (NUDIX family)